VEQGTVLCGYGNLETIPVPEYTLDQISMVLPIPVSFPNFYVQQSYLDIVFSNHLS
jgi:hypothetical protein